MVEIIQMEKKYLFRIFKKELTADVIYKVTAKIRVGDVIIEYENKQGASIGYLVNSNESDVRNAVERATNEVNRDLNFILESLQNIEKYAKELNGEIILM